MITPINNNQITFGKYSIIQIPKNNFKNIESLALVEEHFENIFSKAVSEPTVLEKKIRKFFGKDSGKKFVYFLEQPNFAILMDELKAFGNYSFEWLQLHTGIKLTPPINEDYYSFSVLTKEHKDIEEWFQAAIDNIVKDALSLRIEKYIKGEVYDKLTQEAFINKQLMSLFSFFTESEEPEIYKLNNINELPAIAKEIVK